MPFGPHRQVNAVLVPYLNQCLRSLTQNSWFILDFLLQFRRH